VHVESCPWLLAFRGIAYALHTLERGVFVDRDCGLAVSRLLAGLDRLSIACRRALCLLAALTRASTLPSDRVGALRTLRGLEEPALMLEVIVRPLKNFDADRYVINLLLTLFDRELTDLLQLLKSLFRVFKMLDLEQIVLLKVLEVIDDSLVVVEVDLIVFVRVLSVEVDVTQVALVDALDSLTAGHVPSLINIRIK